MKVQVSVPGKLFLAGEYAVVEAGQPALVAAIDQYLTVTIETSDCGRLYSSQQNLTVSWTREADFICSQDDQSYALIFSAMKVSEEYARSLGVVTDRLYSLSVDSQLDHKKSGAKYGLGSSGAVTVATVKAVLAYYGLQSDAYLIYQLSAIAQLRLRMTGSFGDLAASSYGGVVAYHSLNRTWLKHVLEKHSLMEVLQMTWKDLTIERLDLPGSLSLVIGWTGRPASTDSLVAQVGQQRSQAEKEIFHQSFLARSKSCVEQMIEACHKQDEDSFQRGIAENRSLLQEFAEKMGLVIETSALVQLCQLALEEGAAAKTSGAGGGDCGICFVTDSQQQATIYQKWQEAGIVPLDFAIAEKL